MLYWRRVLAVVRGCQAPKRISAEPRRARKRVRWSVPSGAAQAGFTVGAGYGLYFRRVKHVLAKRHTDSHREVEQPFAGCTLGQKLWGIIVEMDLVPTGAAETAQEY